jgi:hypothetical protein
VLFSTTIADAIAPKHSAEVTRLLA